MFPTLVSKFLSTKTPRQIGAVKRLFSAKWNPTYFDEKLHAQLQAPEHLMKNGATDLGPLRPHKNTRVMRLPLGSPGKKTVILKQYRSNHLKANLKDTFRPSPAQRAFHKAMLMQQHGIPTATPLVAVCFRSWLNWHQESFLIMEDIGTGRTIHQLVLLKDPNWPRRPLLAHLARLIAALNNAGFFHSDPNIGNFLVRGETYRSCQLLVIDVDGIRFCGPLSFDLMVEGLRRVMRRFALAPAERLWFVMRYNRVRRFPLESRRLWAAVQDGIPTEKK